MSMQVKRNVIQCYILFISLYFKSVIQWCLCNLTLLNCNSTTRIIRHKNIGVFREQIVIKMI